MSDFGTTSVITRQPMRSTKAIIHLENFAGNISLIRSRVGWRLICAPVKADAYGHGALACAKAALEAGCAYLAVATVSEGAELRQAGIDAPILLLSMPLPDELGEVASHRLTPLVGDRDFARKLAEAVDEAAPPLPVHLKIDTGMGRLGCRPEEAAELAAFITSCKTLELAGTATHLAVSDSLAEDDVLFTKAQIDKFAQAVESIRKAGVNPGIVHAAASGGILLHTDSYFDMVRPGILLYGYAPSPDLASVLPIKPVMELCSNITFIKKVKKGESISYGRTWSAPEDTFIGTIPLGYGDGLNRLLSNNHEVAINEKRYPLVGRICMDQCMVKLDASVERWDKVTIFGPPPALSATDMAAKLHTIPYEITCNINKRVPRHIIT